MRTSMGDFQVTQWVANYVRRQNCACAPSFASVPFPKSLYYCDSLGRVIVRVGNRTLPMRDQRILKQFAIQDTRLGLSGWGNHLHSPSTINAAQYHGCFHFVSLIFVSLIMESCATRKAAGGRRCSLPSIF